MSIKRSAGLSRYLKDMRIKKGLTQIEVARILGHRSPQMLSNIERALCAPPLKCLSEMVRLYDLDSERTIEMCLAPVRAELEKALKPKSRRKK